MLSLKESFRSVLTAYSNWKGASINRRILGATVIVAALTAVAKIVFFGKELVVAWQFGTMDLLDAFLIAYSMPSFVVNLVAGSFNSAFIPVYIGAREHEGNSSANELYSSAMTFGILLLAICTGLIVLLAPFYLQILASGFDEEKLNLTINLLYLVSPVIILSGVTTIRGAVMNASEKFALPALIPVITPAMTIFLILIGGNILNIYALALGLVLGQISEALLLGRALKRRDINHSFGWPRMDAKMSQAIQQFLPMVAGTFLMGSTQLVDQAFAAALPSGNVAALSYGNKVISFPLQIAATAIGTSVLPYFSSMLARQDWNAARQTLNGSLKLIFMLTVPITLLFVFFSEPLVGVLLQRGAFTQTDTKIVADIQALGALQIPFYLGGILVVRMISAMRANHILMWGAVLNVIVNFAADYWLMKIFGVVGISLSTSIVYFVSFTYLLLMLYYRQSRNDAGR